MKKIISLALGLLLVAMCMAQQEPQYSQFMYNKLGYNPGYAGSSESACLSCIYRSQWIGLKGAPTTQLVSFQMPLQNGRIGVGGNIWRNTIGISETYNAEAAYAYRLRMGRGFLGLGVMTSVRFLRNDYDKTDPLQTDDLSIPGGTQSKYVPNFGIGAYYTSESFFVGFSAPRLLENNIDFAEEDLVLSKEVRHLYLMGGLVLKLSDNVKIQPQALLKYVKNAPFDADVNMSLIALDKYTVGISYRIGGSKESGLGESIDLLLGGQITNNLLFGVAYDITLSELKNYNSGTVEGFVRYCFGKSQGSEYQNPRFF